MTRMFWIFLISLISVVSGHPVFAQMKKDPQPQSQANTLIGHYYLSGIHEVGSELLLKADGRYAWFLAYGGMDQGSDGTWRKDKGDIVLTPDPANPNGLLFGQGELIPWSASLENHVQEEAMSMRNIAIVEACPFLKSNQMSTTSPVKVSSEQTPNDRAQLQSAAENARKYEELARQTYEVLALRAARDGHDAAREARITWEKAVEAQRDAFDQAEMNWREQRPPAPKLPAYCTLELTPKLARDIDPKAWIRGYAVFVNDPKKRINISGVTVNFHHSDGIVSTNKTVSGGLAIVPLRRGVTLSKIELVFKIDQSAKPYSAIFNVPNIKDGIQFVTFNSSLFSPPPFDEMRLKIEGDVLVGFEGRGRYSK